MNWASARSSAPDPAAILQSAIRRVLPARSKSIKPRRSPMRFVRGRFEIEPRRRALAAQQQVGAFVRAVRHFLGRQIRQSGQDLIDLRTQVPRCGSCVCLATRRTYVLQSNLARSLRPVFWPPRFRWRRWLRSACASWARVSAARQSRSSANTSSARGGKPRRASPRSNSAGLSRIHLISCIGQLKHKRNTAVIEGGRQRVHSAGAEPAQPRRNRRQVVRTERRTPFT